MPYFCYLLECSDGTYYCGWTKDVARRVDTHNKGKGARYTRSRRPVILAYFEELDSQSDAMRRERKIKNKSHDQKRKLISHFNESEYGKK